MCLCGEVELYRASGCGERENCCFCANELSFKYVCSKNCLADIFMSGGVQVKHYINTRVF